MSFRVVRTPSFYQVFCDKKWNAMPASEQAAYTVVRKGFATEDAALQYAGDKAEGSRVVNRNPQAEDRDPRSDRRR